MMIPSNFERGNMDGDDVDYHHHQGQKQQYLECYNSTSSGLFIEGIKLAQS